MSHKTPDQSHAQIRKIPPKTRPQLKAEHRAFVIKVWFLVIAVILLICGGIINSLPLMNLPSADAYSLISWRSALYVLESILVGIGGTCFTMGLLSVVAEQASKVFFLYDIRRIVRSAVRAQQGISRSGITACHGADIQKEAEIQTLLSGAVERICIMKTYIPEIIAVKSALKHLVHRKKLEAQILLLDPDSEAAKQRSRDLSRDLPLKDDDIPEKIRGSLEELDQYCRELNIRDRVHIRTYRNLPSISLYQADDKSLLGWHWYGVHAFESVVLEIHNSHSELNDAIRKSFDFAWKNGDDYMKSVPTAAIFDGKSLFSFQQPEWKRILKATFPREEPDVIPDFGAINSIFDSNRPLIDLSIKVMESLAVRGYALVKHFPFGNAGGEERRRIFLAFSILCGVPVPHHTGGVDYIGEIKAIPDRIPPKLPTYSEHNLEAELHTDSNYKEKPERYMALLMVHKAACGGGISSFVAIEDLIKEFEKTAEGRAHLPTLRTKTFPVEPPTKYKTEPKGDYRVIDDFGNIRFRRDTIEAALNNLKNREPDKEAAVKAFSDFMSKSLDRFSVTLDSEDILILDNYRVLHARTKFRDNNRLMLRIRFNPWPERSG